MGFLVVEPVRDVIEKKREGELLEGTTYETTGEEGGFGGSLDGEEDLLEDFWGKCVHCEDMNWAKFKWILRCQIQVVLERIGNWGTSIFNTETNNGTDKVYELCFGHYFIMSGFDISLCEFAGDDDCATRSSIS
jgi:hypothetical protein